MTPTPSSAIEPLSWWRRKRKPFVTDGRKRASIPKDQDAAALTEAECQALIEQAPEPKGKGGGRKKASTTSKSGGSKKRPSSR
jgi:DNA topoisomerase-1